VTTLGGGVVELLCHPGVQNTVAVVVARDLGTAARDGLPRFLARVEMESHALGGQAQRLSIMAILARGQLPAFRGGASSDIAMTSIWWWARIARWDVAAYIAGLAGGKPSRACLRMSAPSPSWRLRAGTWTLPST
jgi:hypothetical protein